MFKIIEDQERALELAKTFAPVFYQGYEKDYDRILPIHLGDFMPDARPAVYYSAKESDIHNYIVYAVFHWKDWSKGKFGGPLRDILDTHRFDLECVSVLVSEDSMYIDWLMSQYHREIKFKRVAARIEESDELKFYIEPQGHGIIPCNGEPKKRECIEYTPNTYDLVCMDQEGFQRHWEILREKLGKHRVTMPDDVGHWIIERKCGRRSRKWFYWDPTKLLTNAEKLLIV